MTSTVQHLKCPVGIDREVARHDERITSVTERVKVVEETIKEINAEGIYDKPIVTEVTPFDKFYSAEGYHQEYFANNPNQPYCAAVVAPKVAKFRQKFVSRLKR